MNLFTKKSKETQPKEEDVPGELPPLGSASGESATPGEGVPDELPSLDAAPTQSAPAKTGKQDSSADKPSIPEALPDIPTTLEKPASAPSFRSSSISDDTTIPSFFSAAIKVGSPTGGDMLSAMKKYWDRRRLQEIPHMSNITNETEMAIQDTVSKLKSLEKAWLAKMQDLNVLKQNIAYLEAEITSNSEELAALLKSRGATSSKSSVKASNPKFKKVVAPKSSRVASSKATSKKGR